MNSNLIMARSLAPEDILPGTYVMVLREQRELLHPVNPGEGDVSPMVTKVSMRPHETTLPRLVLEVNLPFVVVKNFERKTEVLDIRALELARVSKRFARVAVEPFIGEDAPKPRESTCDVCGRP
jgi:hypothetical protein